MSCNRCGCEADKNAVYKITHEVVDDISEVSYFRNAYVTVTNENATYHVDGLGNPVAVSRNPIFSDTYTPQPGDYKMTTVYNFSVGEAYIFDESGNFMISYLYGSGGSS